jgi:ABC-type transport system involved in Fe-S cluster assembly fused permease/ATPase subunit
MMTRLIHNLAVRCQLKQRQCQFDTAIARPVEAVKQLWPWLVFGGLPRVFVLLLRIFLSFHLECNVVLLVVPVTFLYTVMSEYSRYCIHNFCGYYC